VLTPMVSVIIAVKNGRATLQRCLDGIAAQDVAAKEVIVVDSVSTDGTLDLLRRNAADGKVQRYVSEPDSGVYDAWNKGLALASGDWICFLGCDDVYHDAGALRSLVEAAARDGSARVVYGRINRLTPSGHVVETIGQDWRQTRPRFLAGTNIPHPGALHHRSLFEERGKFDATYRIAGDYDLLLRELPSRAPIFVDRVVVDMNLGGISSRPDSIRRALHEIARARAANGLNATPLPLRVAAIKAWMIGVVHRVLGDRGFRLLADGYRLARGKPRIWTV
jgi:glycosyltransferase involved in cell wall biosynthesis